MYVVSANQVLFGFRSASLAFQFSLLDFSTNTGRTFQAVSPYTGVVKMIKSTPQANLYLMGGLIIDSSTLTYYTSFTLVDLTDFSSTGAVGMSGGISFNQYMW